MKTWQLLCIVSGVTGIGVIIILVKTIAQGVTDPKLVPDAEDPYGRTVHTLNYSILWEFCL